MCMKKLHQRHSVSLSNLPSAIGLTIALYTTVYTTTQAEISLRTLDVFLPHFGANSGETVDWMKIARSSSITVVSLLRIGS